MNNILKAVTALLLSVSIAGCADLDLKKQAPPQPPEKKISRFDSLIRENAAQMLDDGRKIFRYDTFGSEAFWGDTLKLHDAIQGEKLGGMGTGLSPFAALSLGLKIDMEALPPDLAQRIKDKVFRMEDPASTLVLLKNNAVIGIKGFFRDDGSLRSVGIQCAFCHSTVDNAFSTGIGHRLDGWPNRDLNVGAMIGLAPNVKAMADRLGIDTRTLKKVLDSWGPGKFDAEVLHDGKGLRADGKSAATLIPPAYGLLGMNLHTYTGWGSVPYWNAYVANTQMRGKGTFFDPRMNNAERFPVAVKTGDWNIRNSPDMVSSKLPALHFYQLSIPAPKASESSFDREKAARGKALFEDKARCSKCHVPPLFSEPGWPMHTASEIGIDDFQANRSPEGRYRTTPLRGLSAHMKGGFYHDGRFPTLQAVVEHYNDFFKLDLTEDEKTELVEYLMSL